MKPTLLNKSCSNQKIDTTLLCIPILKVSITKFQGFFDLSNFFVWPLSAILKGQYRPWALLGRPEQGWYGWISTLWCHSKLPYDGHWIPRLLKQIMATLVTKPMILSSFYQLPLALGWPWFAWAAQEFSDHHMGACCDITKLNSTHINPAPASHAELKADIGLLV